MYFRFRQPFLVVIRCRNRLEVIRACHGRKPQVCRWNFDDICHTFVDISTSGLGSHTAILGCP